MRGGKPRLEERVAAAGGLAPAEQKVARFFVKRREEIAFLSAPQIADLLDVSHTTVTRTARALGYSGLPDLKEELRDELQVRAAAPGRRLARSLDDLAEEDSSAIPDHLLELHVELLNDARNVLDRRAFQRTVDLLGDAGRVVLVATPRYRGLADYFLQGLLRVGIRGLWLGGFAEEVSTNLLELGPEDVLLALAYEYDPPVIAISLEHARSERIPCVLVTDALALALKGRYTVALTARRGDPASYPTAAVPLAILEALLFGLANRDRSQTLDAMDKRDRLLAKFDKPNQGRGGGGGI
jgi:DNA-binding MurR/RpiR family transcriptional regulator